MKSPTLLSTNAETLKLNSSDIKTHSAPSVCICVSLPAEADVFVRRAVRCRAGLEIGHVEVGECVVEEAVHGAIRTVHVLVDEPRDEVRCEGDYKGLQ